MSELATPGSLSLVKLFVRLKLRLLRNVLRTNGRWGLLLFSGASLAVGVGAGVLMARLDAHERFVAGPIVGGLLVFGWLVGPLLFGASDETVDTSRLALFSLDSGPLAAGMAAASIVGPGPVTAVIPLGVLSFRAPGVAHIGLALVASLLTVALATTTSRLALTYLGASLRSRRSRDFATIAAGLMAGLAGAFFQLINLLGLELDLETVERIAGVVRLTPIGWAGDAVGRASSGEIAIPLVEMAATSALLVVILRGWLDVLERVLADVGDSDVRTNQGGHLLRPPRNLAKLDQPRNATLVVLAKERRYLARHPRYRVQVVSQLIVLIIGGAPFLGAVIDREAHAVLLGCIPGLTAGATGSNLLGPDGRALWAEMLAAPRFAPLLRGRSLLFALMGFGSSVIVTFLTAAWTGGWRFAPIALGAAIGMALAGSGVGAFTSCLAPTPMADDDSANPFATSSPGAGCLNGIITVTGVFVGLLLAFPILVGLAYARFSLGFGVLLSLGSPLYGFAIWWTATTLGARRAQQRVPEIVHILSTSL